MVGQQQSFQKIALESWEVGGELLDILSRGLYSDAKDAIREYVQNGVDAQAITIQVTVRGPRAIVRDDGSGMDWDSLRRARRFGVSDKSPKIHVGYRGIGMYAAFGMCETMHITTRQAGTDELLHLELQFGEMRRILERNRASEERVGIGLTDLLYEYTQFRREPYQGDSLDDHFTIVRLDGITQEYRAQLNDASSLNAYLLNTLPVAFPEVGYGPLVNGLLREHVGLNPIRLILRIGSEPEFSIQPQLAENVEAPQHYWVKDTENRNIAFMWHALSTQGERISSLAGGEESSGVSGYLLKLKGFTLGDRLRLKPLWPAVGGRTLYHHYSGEVHVLEAAEVYPNAARDDLESSLTRQSLLQSLQDYFRDLNRRADLTRDILKTQRRMQGIRESLDALQSRDAEADEDPFELYRESKNFIEALERIERELLRLRRGRNAVQPTPRQREQLEPLTAELRRGKGVVAAIVRATARRSEGARRAPQKPPPETPPQVALLARAIEVVKAAYEKSPSPQLERAHRGLAEALMASSAARAIGILDEAKASGVVLPDSVEASRKELRTFLGRSPVAPISLGEALAESGFLTATKRELDLIQAIDSGLLSDLGSRGERYESLLRSIAESVAGHDGLQ